MSGFIATTEGKSALSWYLIVAQSIVRAVSIMWRAVYCHYYLKKREDTACPLTFS